jgi:hypothetical protein
LIYYAFGQYIKRDSRHDNLPPIKRNLRKNPFATHLNPNMTDLNISIQIQISKLLKLPCLIRIKNRPDQLLLPLLQHPLIGLDIEYLFLLELTGVD